MAISTAVQQKVVGNLAAFNTGGALFALSTTPATVSAAVTNRAQRMKSLTLGADTTFLAIFVDSGAPTIPIFSVWLQQNVARTVTENELQGVPTVAAGNALQIQSNTGTPNIVVSGVVSLE